MTDDSIEAFIKSNSYFKSTRLNSLYSDFHRLKQLNPDGYEANVLAWSDLLLSLLKSKKLNSILSIPTPGLSQLLAIPTYSRPDGLPTVIDELVKLQTLIPLSIYKQGDESFYEVITSKRSILDYINPNKWIEWGLSSIGFNGEFSPVDSKGELKDEYYISWAHLVTLGDELYHQIFKMMHSGDYTEFLVDSSILYDHIKGIEPKFSKLDLEILLLFWSRDKHYIAIRKEKENTYIKFVQSASGNEITEDDIGIINLKITVNKLTKRNEILELKLEEIPKKIKGFLKNGKEDPRIRNLLVTKKTIAHSLNKSTDILNQINTILLKINDAHVNLSLFDSMKQSSAILKGLNRDISVEKIDDLRNELDEEITKTDEINEALGTRAESDEEIDEELDKLYKEAVAAEKPKELEKSKESKQGLDETKQEEPKQQEPEEDTKELLQKLEDLTINNKPQPEKQPIAN